MTEEQKQQQARERKKRQQAARDQDFGVQMTAAQVRAALAKQRLSSVRMKVGDSMVADYKKQSASMLDMALAQSDVEARAYLVKCAALLAQNADTLERMGWKQYSGTRGNGWPT